MARPISTDTPLISAVVCTYNRSRLLLRALESLASQALPAGAFEIILVDDGSTDETRDVAEKFSRCAAEFTAIHQRNAGLGAARNAGWRAARARVVAFLDDDAVAPPDWLQRITTAFSAANPKLAVVGGPIDPDWESPPPAWLTRELMAWLTVFDLGAEPITCSDRPVFGGANMAFRTAALLDADGFPTDLGRRGASLLSHEESAVWAALAARGWSNQFLPDLRVLHFVATERLRPAWFRRRLYWEGVSIARQEGWLKPMTPARRLIRLAGIALAKFGSTEFLGPLCRPWRWRSDVRWQTYAAYHCGYAREILRRLREAELTASP